MWCGNRWKGRKELILMSVLVILGNQWTVGTKRTKDSIEIRTKPESPPDSDIQKNYVYTYGERGWRAQEISTMKSFLYSMTELRLY
jgi:lipopolysaccharide export system protein LptC